MSQSSDSDSQSSDENGNGDHLVTLHYDADSADLDTFVADQTVASHPYFNGRVPSYSNGGTYPIPEECSDLYLRHDFWDRADDSDDEVIGDHGVLNPDTAAVVDDEGNSYPVEDPSASEATAVDAEDHPDGEPSGTVPDEPDTEEATDESDTSESDAFVSDTDDGDEADTDDSGISPRTIRERASETVAGAFDALGFTAENHNALADAIRDGEYDDRLDEAYEAESERERGAGPRSSIMNAIEDRADETDVNLSSEDSSEDSEQESNEDE